MVLYYIKVLNEYVVVCRPFVGLKVIICHSSMNEYLNGTKCSLIRTPIKLALLFEQQKNHLRYQISRNLINLVLLSLCLASCLCYFV